MWITTVRSDRVAMMVAAAKEVGCGGGGAVVVEGEGLGLREGLVVNVAGVGVR